MKIVAFVPIRLNSTRLKNKSILPLGNKPLCWHILNTLTKVFNEVYVYASTEQVMDFSPEGTIFLKRPAVLDRDETLGMEIYSSFVGEIDSDYYCLAHVTSPFLTEKTLQSGVDALLCGHDSAFTARREQTFAWFRNKPINYATNFIPRTQDMEPVYIETSGYYMFDNQTIKAGRRIGGNPAIIEVGAVEGLDIDEEGDYEVAKLFARGLIS